ncbi:hypothetical protein NF700_08030 [Sphingomonadaceae bacterium OTU29MARTA1]|uniref:hypothetical protein n=1 Tax=Sphingomonas sp. Leaf37 TaxID=2876552 RepID=UPI001E31B2F8|nr:hypothetical protein [Sphingomonas sp. Leaf37]USU06824.1 hypothetical protein NF699_09250 [Sphingomonadaceae bacterium OTU29LAMAA1]USU10192.1 hypothetical protein NF700_08030 [Sphingomonadaceae bacterium OTU29MARTA1]
MNDDSDSSPSPADRSGPSERTYWSMRADVHRQRAEDAQEKDTRSIHLKLAELYDEHAATVGIVHPDQ